MTATLHGTPYPMAVVPNASTTGGNPARAEILQTHAGRTRHLYEMLKGQALDNVPACAPSPAHAPNGVPGHDHSGGIFGVPIVRTLYSAVFGYDDTYLTTDVAGGRAPQMDLQAGDPSGAKRFIYQGDIKTVWIPGCASDGCYIDALLTLRMYASAAADLHMVWSSGGFTTPEQTRTTGTGLDLWSVSQRVALYPGRLGVASLTLWMEGTGGSGPTVSLLAMGLHQTKTAP